MNPYEQPAYTAGGHYPAAPQPPPQPAAPAAYTPGAMWGGAGHQWGAPPPPPPPPHHHASHPHTQGLPGWAPAHAGHRQPDPGHSIQTPEDLAARAKAWVAWQQQQPQVEQGEQDIQLAGNAASALMQPQEHNYADQYHQYTQPQEQAVLASGQPEVYHAQPQAYHAQPQQQTYATEQYNNQHANMQPPLPPYPPPMQQQQMQQAYAQPLPQQYGNMQQHNNMYSASYGPTASYAPAAAPTTAPYYADGVAVAPPYVYGTYPMADAGQLAQAKKKVPEWVREALLETKQRQVQANAASNNNNGMSHGGHGQLDNDAVEDMPARAVLQNGGHDLSESESDEDAGEEAAREAERQAALNMEIKKVLTEILLKVTDSLFREIAMEVLHETDGETPSKPTRATEDTPRVEVIHLVRVASEDAGASVNPLGLGYGDSDSDDDEERRQSGEPAGNEPAAGKLTTVGGTRDNGDAAGTSPAMARVPDADTMTATGWRARAMARRMGAEQSGEQAVSNSMPAGLKSVAAEPVLSASEPNLANGKAAASDVDRGSGHHAHEERREHDNKDVGREASKADALHAKDESGDRQRVGKSSHHEHVQKGLEEKVKPLRDKDKSARHKDRSRHEKSPSRHHRRSRSRSRSRSPHRHKRKSHSPSRERHSRHRGRSREKDRKHEHHYKQSPSPPRRRKRSRS